MEVCLIDYPHEERALAVNRQFDMDMNLSRRVDIPTFSFLTSPTRIRLALVRRIRITLFSDYPDWIFLVNTIILCKQAIVTILDGILPYFTLNSIARACFKNRGLGESKTRGWESAHKC